MFLRLFAIFLTSAFTVGVLGLDIVSHRPARGGTNPGVRAPAPEFDPTALRSGLALLAGGLLVLNEGRLKKD
jgi:hypothetical protein